MFIYPSDPRYADLIRRRKKCFEYDGLMWTLKEINGDKIFVAIDVCPEYQEEEEQDGEEVIQTYGWRQSDFR